MNRESASEADLLLFESECPVDPLDDDEDDGLPADQPPQPVEQLAVHDVRLLPRGREHPLQVNLRFKKRINHFIQLQTLKKLDFHLIENFKIFNSITIANLKKLNFHSIVNSI